MEVIPDEELIAECLSAPGSDRSRQLIDELFRRHRARVVAWCHRLTGDRDLAPDLAHDVFVKAYTSLHTFRRDSKFTTWLYIIARNRCRDEARSRAVRREAPETELPDTASELNDVLGALDARDARTILRMVMADVLDDTEKRVLALHYGHDMRLDAITAALGLTNASGAKAYIVSARRKLTAAVKRWKTNS
jgi:RNA polymerase sigma-70 factor, ECF subfamily